MFIKDHQHQLQVFFSAVPKIAGIAVLIKFMYVPFLSVISEWKYILIFMSIASMILGAVAAIGQKNIKRLMAYSSIGHIGYAIAGIASGTENGFKSTLVYISIYLICYEINTYNKINKNGCNS